MSWDAIVVGAGHNGLVAAARLGQAGRRVLLLEALEGPGGLLGAPAAGQGAGSGGTGPGVRIAAQPTWLNPIVTMGLGLDRYGLGPGVAQPTRAWGPDGPVTLTAGSALGVAPETAAAYAALHARLRRLAGPLARFMGRTPPPLNGAGAGDLLALALDGLALRRLGRADMRELLRILLSNVWDLLEDSLGDGPLAGALAFDATLGGAMGPRSPGTVLPLLYRLAGAPRGADPEILIGALLKAVAATGGVLRCGAPVARILVGDNDRAEGVQLESGEEFRAPLVLSNLHPRRTLTGLLGVAHLDAEDVRRARLMATRGMAARIDLRLATLPEALPAGTRLVVAPRLGAVEAAFDGAKYGGLPERPVLEAVLVPGAVPRLAVTATFVPHAPAGSWTGKSRGTLETRVVAALDEALPGLRSEVTGIETMTPDDIEARYGLPGGHWHHGEFRTDQMLMLRPFARVARYRLPVAGLYLCGAGSHPGGDITGLPGWNAAGQALKDEGKRR
ncbi:MAG: NAD(P)/FAD-dependent oxidoreductase [Defluviimonas sp.]|uniref:phytoene desaturase family protein n=1 Tax=Albidovulum sp. TaxID=1872424 RepID=UPI001DE60096|nr:NAD(P)/FAD-dependent oxidoreductase [Paracoccaceae bacterium]MCC0064142.1 NAD(P)/FAD-dependent oxidoreductase [Defluviimonas sp.]